MGRILEPCMKSFIGVIVPKIRVTFLVSTISIAQLFCKFIHLLCYLPVSLFVTAKQALDRSQMGFEMRLAQLNQSSLPVAKI